MALLPLSDRTIAEQLARRLRQLEVISLFTCPIGIGEFRATAFFVAPDATIRKVESFGKSYEDCICLLLTNLELATAPEDT